MEKGCLDLIKSVHQKPSTNIILNSKKYYKYTTKVSNEIRMLLSLTYQ